MASFLCVSAAELKRRIGLNPYLALPKEEIEQFFAAVAVHRVDDPSGCDDDRLLIRSWVILHYNYNWMVFGANMHNLSDEWMLGFPGPSFRDETEPLFLGEDFLHYTHSFLDRVIRSEDRFELRMAGLLIDPSPDQLHAHLDLVCVARLPSKQVNVLDPTLRLHRIMGTGELTGQRLRFEPTSRFLIGKLYGF